MNKLMLLFILILTVTTFAFSDETNDLDKWSIVVFDFKPINVSKTFADTITESIITKIVKTEEYIVFERSQLNKIFKEIKLTSGDDFTDENIYKPEIRFTEI
ncbi:MAG TPA: CsgG/HfaB family protein [Spirochaetota bacterium]|nr:CsgG/HfaB family protein [Spirochaetota bacterium]